MKPSPWQRFVLNIKKALGMNIFLCDTCSWNWPNACKNPGRPNVTTCPEYKKGG
jgi:hypothetical protein